VRGARAGGRGGLRLAGNAFFESAHEAVKPLFEGTTSLATFVSRSGKLTKDERLLLIEQALILFEMNYVHLPLKRAMHAVDPIQRLKLLRYRVEQTEESRLPDETHFHNEMTEIFTSLRDLHTTYRLPAPYQRADAILPFSIEEYFEDGLRKYLLSYWATGFNHATFKPGVEITYWNGVPIERCNGIGQRYYGNVVLITDARCYSTTDIFAAGFQDNKIGTILGTSGNTGAGGANVWGHGYLRRLMEKADPPAPYKELPNGADMTVAIRRTLRAGANAGTPVEDLGIIPDFRHEMTRDDVLKDNVDLINKAASLLADKPVRKLSIEVGPGAGSTRNVTATTLNVSRLDVFLDGRPQQSLDVSDGATQFVVALPSPGGAMLELQGYDKGELVISRRAAVA
jgi:hypothetical protein